MTRDETADQTKIVLDAIHAHIADLPDGQLKTRAERLAKLMHGAADGLKDLGVDGGLISPMSGGTPKS